MRPMALERAINPGARPLGCIHFYRFTPETALKVCIEYKKYDDAVPVYPKLLVLSTDSYIGTSIL